jgi:hypothetical protein
MRSHGIASFPDPVNQGGAISVRIDAGASFGIDPNSPSFQAAQQACQSLLPQGVSGANSRTQERQAQILLFSGCMRANGVPDFPDPGVSSGVVSLKLPSSIDPYSAAFQSAERACQSFVPGSGPASLGLPYGSAPTAGQS